MNIGRLLKHTSNFPKIALFIILILVNETLRKLHPKISGADDQMVLFSPAGFSNHGNDPNCPFFWGGEVLPDHSLVHFYTFLLVFFLFSPPRTKTNANQQSKLSSNTNIPGKKKQSLNKFASLSRFFLRTTILSRNGTRME